MTPRPMELDRLRELLNALVDGVLDGSGRSELGEMLRSDAAARRYYLSHMTLDAALEARREGGAPAASIPMPRPATHAPVPPRRVAMWNRMHGVAIAAALLLVGGAMIAVMPALMGEAGRSPAAQAARIATVIETTGTMYAGDRPAISGQEIGAGPVSIGSGYAEFQLLNGTNVQLRGRASLTIDGLSRATLAEGSATFDCPPAAKGYTVAAPGGWSVVDLGTQFNVTAEGGASTVRVFEGRVELRRGQTVIELTSGRGLSLGADGATGAIDEVMSVDDVGHPRIEAAGPIGPVSEFPAEGRFAASHLLDDRITGPGADYAGKGPGPHDVTIDLGGLSRVRGVRFAHRADSGDHRVDQIARLELTFGESPAFDPQAPADLAISPDLERRDPQAYVFGVRVARYVRVRFIGTNPGGNPGASMLHLLGEPADELETNHNPSKPADAPG